MLCCVMLCSDVMLSDRHNVVILAGSGVVMASVQSVTARHCPDATNNSLFTVNMNTGTSPRLTDFVNF